MKKKERQTLIRQVVTDNAVATQEDLVQLLHKSGLTVTQATISRDITDLQLIKMPDKEGQTRYTLPTGCTANGEGKLRRNLAGNVEQLSISDRFCLLTVSPGSGPVIGTLMKQMNYPEVFGVLSDDATVLIIANTNTDATQLQNRLRALGA